MKAVIITNHAYKRLKKRSGLKKRVFEKLVLEAFNKGFKHNCAIGSLKKYCDSLYMSHKQANNIRFYKNYTFLFDRNILITMFTTKNDILRLVKNNRGDGVNES